MKVYYECAPCFLRQAREALDLACNDENLKIEIMEEIVALLGREFHKGAVSNVIGTSIHRLIKEKTGNEDPYHEIKVNCNEIAESFLPHLTKFLQGEEKMEMFIKAAIVGNLIDFGALGVNVEPLDMMMSALDEPLEVNHTKELEKSLKSVKSVLYLADNTGEIVFDKLLINKLKEYDVDITVALKEKPILNDACLEDAYQVGLDKVAQLVTTGTDSVGVIHSQVSPEFQKMMEEAELIISKGLGNYEGLTEIKFGEKPVFCLLNAKCGPTSRDIGVAEGSNVMIKIN
jgi:damage-control phosphatase, subfamily I